MKLLLRLEAAFASWRVRVLLRRKTIVIAKAEKLMSVTSKVESSTIAMRRVMPVSCLTRSCSQEKRIPWLK